MLFRPMKMVPHHPPVQYVIVDALPQRSCISLLPVRAVENPAAPRGADLSTSQPHSFYCLLPMCQLSIFFSFCERYRSQPVVEFSRCRDE